MKKIFVLLFASMLLLSSSALAVSQSEYDEVIDQRNALYHQIIEVGLTPVISFDSDMEPDEATENSSFLPSSEYEVSEYRWQNSSYYHNDLVVKNTSGRNCRIEITMVFFDESGIIVGISEETQRACESGFETFFSLYNDIPFDHVKYTISLEDEEWYSCVQSDLELQSSIVGNNKIILSARNSGYLVMEFVEYNVLYLDDSGSVVGWDRGYLTDSDYELKPGKTQYAEEYCSSDFSSVLFFANGRSD